MRWVDIEQNTDEWLALRAGKVGGSSIGKIMANYGKTFGQPAKDFAAQIAVEQLTGRPIGSNYTNAHIDRGHEQEPIARALYEDETFCVVSNGGYYTDDELIGVSPDGLIYDEGIIEIKSVIAHVQYKTVKRGSFDPAYKWQLLFNLKNSGREWIDYVSFCADFPEGKRLYIHREYRKNCTEEFNQIDTRMKEFAALVEEAKQTIRGRA